MNCSSKVIFVELKPSNFRCASLPPYCSERWFPRSTYIAIRPCISGCSEPRADSLAFLHPMDFIHIKHFNAHKGSELYCAVDAIDAISPQNPLLQHKPFLFGCFHMLLAKKLHAPDEATTFGTKMPLSLMAMSVTSSRTISTLLVVFCPPEGG